jgi:hypothetical protein
LIKDLDFMIDIRLEGIPHKVTQQDIDDRARFRFIEGLEKVLHKKYANALVQTPGIISSQLTTELEAKGVRITLNAVLPEHNYYVYLVKVKS